MHKFLHEKYLQVFVDSNDCTIFLAILQKVRLMKTLLLVDELFYS